MTTKAQHARIVEIYKSDIQMTKENTAQIIDLYETNRMNDEARAAFDALLAFAGELKDEATPADIFRIWKQLWGDRTPEQVANYSGLTEGEQYDRTQFTDREIAEME